MQGIGDSLRLALRQWRRAPGFTALAALTLALGIGATASLFSVVRAVLWQPLPYPQPERLVRLWDRNEAAGLRYFSVSVPNFAAWGERSRVFAALGAYREAEFSLLGPAGPEQVQGARVSSGVFDVLGTPPLIGRAFSREEDRPGGPNLAVIGHGLWQGRFGGDPAVLGRDLILEGQPYSVVGVMPAGFVFPQQGDLAVLVPYRLQVSEDNRANHVLRVLGRLRDGVDLESARADLGRVASELQQELPATNEGYEVALLPLHEAIVGDVKPALGALFAAVVGVLLIGCVNVAGLLLARGLERRREVAIRAALGATPRRILAQMLSESLALGLLGGALGVGASLALTRALVFVLRESVPRLAEARTDAASLVFALALTLLTSLLSGSLPALAAARRGLRDALSQMGGVSAPASGSASLRGGLVVAQIALALVLLVGGGLLLRSLLHLQAVEPGFDARGVLTARIAPLEAEYPDPPRRTRFYREVVAEIASLPGVEQAALVHRLPLAGNSIMPVVLPGGANVPPQSVPTVNWRAVSPAYFAALRIPLLRGRSFSEQEAWEKGGVAVVNQAMAEKFWPGADPVGRRFGPRPEGPWMEVVGVIADVREGELAAPAEPAAYLPYVDAPVPGMTLVTRGASEPLSHATAIRAALLRVNPGQPIAGFASLDDAVAERLAGPRRFTALLGTLGIVGLSLAMLGLYALLSYLVAQGAREIGVRLALGATRAGIHRFVLRRSLGLVGLGLGLGLPCALAAARSLRSQLVGVEAFDPATFAAMAALLTGVAVVASLVPARRASRVDPLVALRSE